MIFFIVLINIYSINIKVKTKTDVVELSLNEYISGVIGSEVPKSWSSENFKVMAILARTYVLEKYKLRKNKAYFVKDSVLDQVYKPIKDVNAYNRILKQVIDTDNLVLVDSNENLYKVFYHSNCGGLTELPSNVWGGTDNYTSVKCLHCKNAPNSNWIFSITIDDLKQFFFKEFKNNTFKDIKISTYTINPRVKNLNIYFQNSKNTISAQKLRELIGFNKIRSTNFIISKENNNYIFSGKGWGHGVGLCQWGMKNLIEKSFDYTKVLEFYFPAARIKKISYEYI